MESRGVEEADVLVHVEEVLVGEAFDVFVHGCDLLEVLVLWVVLVPLRGRGEGVGEMYLAVTKDGEVDDDAVDSVIGVCSENVFFEFVFGHFAELELEATGGGGVSLKPTFFFFGRRTHFCLHVFCVQFAYIRAAGSLFAKNPTSSGALSIFSKLALTSFNRPSATVAAETTLQVAGGGSWLYSVELGIFSLMFAGGRAWAGGFTGCWREKWWC